MSSNPTSVSIFQRLFRRSIATILLPVIINFLFSSSSKAAGNPVSVTGVITATETIGTQTFINLTAAFNAINSGVISGDIVVTISGSTNESGTVGSSTNYGAVLYGSASANAPLSSYTSVVIKLNSLALPADTTLTITGNSPFQGVINFVGADNVSLDGSVLARPGDPIKRNLLIINTNTTTTGGVNLSDGIDIAAASTTNPANNVRVKNCIIKNSSNTSYAGIYILSPANYDTLSNNLISTTSRGVEFDAYTGIVGTFNTVNNNYIGSTNAADKISLTSINVYNQANISIYNDTIRGLTGTYSGNNINAGIRLSGVVNSGSINSNVINDIKNSNTLGWSAHGICLNITGGAGGLKIYNNFIYDVLGYGYASASTDNGYGIGVIAGTGYNIYYNSINMTGAQSAANAPSAAIYISSAITGSGALDIRNNIFSNQESSGNRYAIYSAAGSGVYSNIDYNDYYAPVTGYLGSARSTIADWRIATGKDVYSLSDNPQFISSTNLHLNTQTSPLNGRATYLTPGYTKDIDDDTRDVSTPDVGADEFTPSPCSSFVGGTITSSATSFCGTGSVTLAATGYSGGSGIVYQWQSSNDGGASWSNILLNATNPVQYVSSTLFQTTLFRLSVGCGSNSGYSNVITVTINSVALSSTSGNSRCGIGTTTLSATSLGGTASINWYADSTKTIYLGNSNSGVSWTTPEIRTTTTFYAAAYSGSQSEDVAGAALSISSSQFNSEATPLVPSGLYFTTTAPNMTINSLSMPYTGSGTMTFQLIEELTGITTSTTTVTVGDGGGSTSLKVIPVNIPVTVAGSYYIVLSAYTGISGLKYSTLSTLGVNYPFSALNGAISVTGSSWNNTSNTTWFDVIYGMNVSKQCVGSYAAVTATVTTPPQFSITSPATVAAYSICQGNSVTLTAANSVASPAYTFTWSNGFSGASQTITPSLTTIYTVSGNNGTCRRDSTFTITVNAAPTALDVTPAVQTVCATTSIVPLTVTGGTFPTTSVVYTQNIEAYTTAPLVPFALPEYTPQVTPDFFANLKVRPSTTYYYEGTKAMSFRYRDLCNESYSMNRDYDLSTYSNPKLSFAHLARLEPNDTAFVEYSTDQGVTWNRFPTTAYKGTGTAVTGTTSANFNGKTFVFYNTSSYTDWNFPELYRRYMPYPASLVTPLWRVDTLDLTNYKSTGKFRIRFRITSDANNIRYYGWLVDNIKITNTPQVSVTWGLSNFNGGSGYSNAFIPFLYRQVATTSASSSGTTVTVPSTTGLLTGAKVLVNGGTGAFAAGTTITSITNSTQFVVSATPSPALASATVLMQIRDTSTPNIVYFNAPNSTAGPYYCIANTSSANVCFQLKDTGIVNFAATATPTVTITSNRANVCQNDTTLFTASVSNYTGASLGYRWFRNISNLNASSSGTTITVPSTTGLYVGATVLVSGGTGAFTSSAPFSTTIATIPTSTTFTVATAPTTALVNATVLAQVNSSNATNNTGFPTTYNFSFPTASVTDIIACQVFNGTANCTGFSTPINSNTVSVNVGTTPPTITAIAGANGTVTPPGTTAVNCLVNSQAYVVTANSGFSIDTVIITIGGVETRVNRPASPYNYTFTNVSGTNNSIRAVFYNAACPISPSAVAGSNVTLCGVRTQSLTSATVTGPTGIAATWSTTGSGTFNGGTTWGSTTGYLPSSADSALGSVILTLTTNNPTGGGCVVSSSSITITIKATPAATLSGNLGLCNGAASTTLSITATMAPGTGNVLGYYWYNGSTLLNAGGTSSTTQVFNSSNISAVDSVKIPASNGCTTAIALPIVSNATSPTGIAISGTTPICVDNTSTLNSTYTTLGTGASSVSYVWRIDNVTQANSNNSVFIAAYPGAPPASKVYKVVMTNNLGCKDSVTYTLSSASAALSGTYTIGGSTSTPSCTNYTSFKNAISDLNTRSISGPVTFLVSAGITEVVPSGGLKLGNTIGSPSLNTMSSSYSISFVKSGEGANPKLYNYANTTGTYNSSSATPDGIWSLNGIDSVTIDGIDLADTGSVATVGPLMEYGYGLFKASVTDGAQNNTIKNCVITLNKANSNASTAPMVEGSTGILVINSLVTTATTASTPTAASGTNSRNKFYTNTIQNCNHGIALIGYNNTVSPYNYVDSLNDIGGNDASTGNTIINFGGGGTQASSGIRSQYQRGVNISFNTINNNDGSGLFPQGALNGVLNSGSYAGSTTINNNIVTVKGGAASGTVAIKAIDNAVSAASPGISYTVSVNNNVITGQHTSSTSGNWSGITNAATSATTVSIDNNRIENCTLPATATTATWTGILNSAADTTLSISNNVINNCNIASTSSIVCISNSSSTVNNITMNGNSITGITKGATTTTNTSWLNAAANRTINVSQNTISNNTMVIGSVNTATFAINCINISAAAGAISSAASGNTIYNNSLTGITTTGAGLVSYRGINFLGTTTTETASNNNITNLLTGVAVSGTNRSAVYGLFSWNTNNSSNKNFNNNIIDSLATQGADSAVVGMYNYAGGDTVNIYKNKISRLYAAGSTSATKFVSGIRLLVLGAATAPDTAVCTMHNNMINLDLGSVASNSNLSGADALKGIDLPLSTAPSKINVYYNTILLARTGASGSASFGSSAISSAKIAPFVNYTNNIFVNRITTSSGLSVALRRSEATAGAPLSAINTHSTRSNNNLFYAGTASASNLLYYDGYNSAQDIASLKTLLLPRDSSSISFDPIFISTTDLHLNTTSNCAIDGAGKVIADYTTDIDEQVRDSIYPDLGADEHNQTGGGGSWKGYSSDWNETRNWCGVLPTAITNVDFPSNKQKYPIITTSGPVCNNIVINARASVTVTGLNSKLIINGSITNSGNFDVKYGTIELAGSTKQIIPQGAFADNNIRNLVINNSASDTSVSLRGALNVLGKLSFAGSNRLFATNDTLTLKSSDTLTASVADITKDANTLSLVSGNRILGRVRVERYISNRKAWRLLSMPTRHDYQTIKESWQENGSNLVSSTPAQQNPVPGFGTQITSNRASWNNDGFDTFSIAGPSMKWYNPATNLYDGLISTKSVTTPNSSNGRFEIAKAYMTFIRGDRSKTRFTDASSPTILREKGTLFTGDTTISLGTGSAAGNYFISIGNPYASAIDFTKLTRTNLNSSFYLWDPKLGTYGAYQNLLIGAGNSISIAPGGGSYTTGNYSIQSGQGFLVQTNGSVASIGFKELAKADGSALTARVNNINTTFRTNLYQIQATGPVLYDGILQQFDETYSNDVDAMDAAKMGNMNENIAIKKSNKLIAIESRKNLSASDTIFYSLGQVRLTNYQLEFIPDNISQFGVEGYLEDSYLNTRTPISMTDITTVNFTVNASAGSYASDRFRIVFKQLAPVPVSFISIRADKIDKDVKVSWGVNSESNVREYVVEKSTDGRLFTQSASKAAEGNNNSTLTYEWLDVQPAAGVYYYRIKSVSNNGEIKYTSIVRVTVSAGASLISIHPNPIQDDRKVNISFENLSASIYKLTVLNSVGQKIMKKTFEYNGGRFDYSFELNKRMSHGNYIIELVDANGNKSLHKILY